MASFMPAELQSKYECTVAKKLLATNSTGSIGYYFRLFMETQL